jgi:hypothetical protein
MYSLTNNGQKNSLFLFLPTRVDNLPAKLVLMLAVTVLPAEWPNHYVIGGTLK